MDQFAPPKERELRLLEPEQLEDDPRDYPTTKELVLMRAAYLSTALLFTAFVFFSLLAATLEVR